MFHPLHILLTAAVAGMAALASLAIRSKPGRNRNRKDPSLANPPLITNVTMSIVGGSIKLTSPTQLVIQPNNVRGLAITHGGTIGLVDTVTQLDDFNVAFKSEAIATVVAGDSLEILPGMTGLRSIRGGVLAIGPATFPA